jgi:hypothetical protein
VFERFRADNLRGVRFALNAFVGTTALWLLLRHLAGVNPIWAIASMVAASEPIMRDALRMLRARMITGGSSEWKLPIAISIAVLVSSYFVRIPTMWRQAPITAAIVIASGLEQHSKLTGAEQGLRRVAEVLLGCIVGFIVSWLMSHVWPMPETRLTEAANR